jgi:hypothetical protein
MRKTTRRAAAIPAVRPSSTLSQLPDGLGSLHFRSGSYWMSYRLPDGCRVQTNTHSKNITVARVMLAERVLQRVAALTLHLEGVIREGAGALAAAGTAPADTHTGRRARRVGARTEAPARNRTEVAQ